MRIEFPCGAHDNYETYVRKEMLASFVKRAKLILERGRFCPVGGTFRSSLSSKQGRTGPSRR